MNATSIYIIGLTLGFAAGVLTALLIADLTAMVSL